MSFVSFSQTKPTTPIDTTKQTQTNPNIVGGVDISNASPNEKQLIMYMETLTYEQKLEVLKLFVVGEIYFKEKN